MLLAFFAFYEYSYPRDEFCFNEKFWKPVFRPLIALFNSDQSRNSNVRSRIRTSGRDSERPAEIPNVGGPFLDLYGISHFFPNSWWLMYCSFPSDSVRSICGFTVRPHVETYRGHLWSHIQAACGSLSVFEKIGKRRYRTLKKHR